MKAVSLREAGRLGERGTSGKTGECAAQRAGSEDEPHGRHRAARAQAQPGAGPASV